jgi:rhamnose utilization protein RhaD (predicted bifunctional aldolase and dehydrogenase)/NAD(P)-dependent dehydrogenase (short-subunit alcohol dehydrogenase family)
VSQPAHVKTHFLEDLWHESAAADLAANPLELLRYRSNLLGSDLRITNFGGGNTSSKFDLPDPLTGEPVRVMAVKGSGGDLRSIGTTGFAVLYQDRLERLIDRYRGEAHEDEMVALYALCAFGDHRVAASIDTPLHAFLPFAHVDHLHPDWAIALAASANGRQKLDEFNREFDRRIVWVPWQRPGFELALMLRRAVAETPGCDGVVLGGHGLFTWGHSQRDCYLSSIVTIDQMGQFVDSHIARQRGHIFGGTAVEGRSTSDIAATLLPHLRGVVSSHRPVIAHWDQSDDAVAFAGAAWAEGLCRMGTSCPDHFLRTRISPMFVPWDPARHSVEDLLHLVERCARRYREEYSAYYQAHAAGNSPAMRGADPSVVVIPTLGVFGFAKDKREARITTEFFVNAIHVMRGATALEDGEPVEGPLPQARHTSQAPEFSSLHNYVALPRSEAFRIEYWALEEAKLQRMPAEKEFSRQIACVVGAGSGIGREVALLLARRGAHVIVADVDAGAVDRVAADVAASSTADAVLGVTVDLGSRDSIRAALGAAVLRFGGLDIVINTAAIYPTPPPGTPVEETWARALAINVTANHVLAEEAAAIMRVQGLPASLVLTSSANAVVPKSGSEPYDVSKAAVNHLIRELAVGLGPLVRVNGIAPATVVAGSAMFPRDRVIASLEKYGLPWGQTDSTEALRDRLADFYAQRTITRRPILPTHCALAIAWLAGSDSGRTTGHVLPVDGGLSDAFQR